MYLGIQPVPLRGGGGGAWGVIGSELVYTSLGSSIHWPSISVSFQSKVKLLSPNHHPFLFNFDPCAPPPFFSLLPVPLPAAHKHTLITVSYLWWRFNNSWPQVSRACAGVARVIHHDLANLLLKSRGHAKLCRGKCGQRQQPLYSNTHVNINKV